MAVLLLCWEQVIQPACCSWLRYQRRKRELALVRENYLSAESLKDLITGVRNSGSSRRRGEPVDAQLVATSDVM